MRSSGPASFVAIAMACFGFAQESLPPLERAIDGVTFSFEDETVYVPIKELGYAFGWVMRSEDKKFFVNERAVTTPRILPDGTRLIPLSSLPHLNLSVLPDEDGYVVSDGSRDLHIRLGEKRVVINKAEQKLRGYQGERLIVETRVSTGRRGYTTPSGTWTAGPEKSRMRYSRKYDNAPMPWAIQITGGYFMHGYTSVPKRPASHGCVRLPLWGVNYAKWLFHWIDLGTPITIADSWGETKVAKATAPKAKGPETIAVSGPKN